MGQEKLGARGPASRPLNLVIRAERANGRTVAVGTAGRRRWARREYLLLVGIALVITLFAGAFFYFGADASDLRRYGYAGLFLVNLLGAASIFLPSPAAASVVGGGAFLENFLGVPAPFWVGLVAGLAEALGELTGYLAGYGGRVVVQDHPQYQRVYSWMAPRGALVMFLMSVVPNPLFDVAGLVAGALQMPLGRFFLAVLLGKVIKGWYMAAAGALGFSLLTQLG